MAQLNASRPARLRHLQLQDLYTSGHEQAGALTSCPDRESVSHASSRSLQCLATLACNHIMMLCTISLQLVSASFACAAQGMQRSSLRCKLGMQRLC